VTDLDALKRAQQILEANANRERFTPEHARSMMADLTGAESKRALAVDSDTSGIANYTTFSKKFFDTIESLTVFAKIARSVEPPSGSLSVPVATSLPVASVIAEGATFPESDPVTEAKVIDIVKIGTSVRVTEEYMQDANQSFIESLVNQISKSIANKLDLDAYNAILASSPVESQAHVGNSSAAVVDLDDLCAALGKLNQMARNPVWVMSPSVYAMVARRMIAHASGSQDDLASGRPGLKMLGYDVLLSSQMPAAPAPGETYGLLLSGEEALTFAHRGPQYATVRQLEETYAATGEVLLLGSIRGTVGVTDKSMIVNLTLSDS